MDKGTYKILLPDLGEGIEKATVACWHYSVGDRIKEGTDIVEVVTDKAVFNIPAEAEGILKQILIQANQEAIVGSVLAIIEP